MKKLKLAFLYGICISIAALTCADAQVSGTSGAYGAAGGVLTGSYPNPTFAASPTFVTPTLGVARATSLGLGGAADEILTLTGGFGHFKFNSETGGGSWYDTNTLSEAWFAGTDSTGDFWRIYSASSGNSVLRVGGDGSVYMPMLSSSSAAQTGSLCWSTGTGNITVDTTTTCILSLEDRKNIRGNIDGAEALKEVSQLKPIWFSYKRGFQETDFRVHAGLGAHQVEQIDKRLVGYDAHGNLQGVRYADSVLSLSVAAISALRTQNIALEKRIAKLEGELKK